MRGLSLFLLALGAILTFATNFLIDGVDLNAVGIILMVVGGIGLVLGLLRGSSTRVERQVSSDGRTLVEDRRSAGY
jgi:hypothetical protein